MILSTAGNKIPNQRQPKTLIFLIEVWACSFRFGSTQRCPAPAAFLSIFDLLPLLQDSHLSSKHHINFFIDRERRGSFLMSPIPESSTLVMTGSHAMCWLQRRLGELVTACFGFLTNGKPALLIGRKALGRKPTSASVMNSFLSLGSLSSLIELELNRLNYNYDKLVFFRNQFISGLFLFL